MKLLYKTRGNTTPQGKARVYFCCHKDDFASLFEEIANDILAKQNCAVWYAEGGECEYTEEYLDSLREMQLFVMPVTYKLLCTENDALNKGFGFAVENKIPVLPLIQDEGLVEIFNKKCGDLQYLDKNATDDTAINYSEKLEKYLSSVLIGDELAEKIRNAFDAYVFLSYRKKDRKYAQELMRLIHKNEFCRDIAIWYDEYLTPGENFNDSIKSAMEKSGLFVLAVTPNLVNEQNYIMTTEYPMAKSAGKPILPAELVPTDKQLLSEKYHDIPDCTDARNDLAMSVALTDALSRVAIKENDDSPMHNFFIGLAYLGGIDVEVDFERAVKLITFAAESGLVEAMEKLADMYQNGMGVERDYDQMILWLKRRCNHFEAKYNSERSAEALAAYLDVIAKLIYQLINVGQGEGAVLAAYYAIDKAVESGYLGNNSEVDVNTAQLYLTITKVFINNRKSNEALSFALKSRDSLETSYKRNEDVKVLYKIIQVESMLSVINMSIGKMHDAIKSGTEAVKRAEELYGLEKNLETRYLLATSCISLCGTLAVANEPDGAWEYCKKALELGVCLAEEDSDNKNMHLVASCYKFMAMIERKKRNYAEYEAYSRKEIAIRKDIYEKYPTAQNLNFWGKCYKDLGESLLDQKKPDEAEGCFTEALDIAERLCSGYGAVQYYLFLADIFGALAKMKKIRKDYLGAEADASRKIEILKKQEEREKIGVYARDLAVTYMTLGSVKCCMEQYDEAKEIYFKAAEIFDKLHKENGSKFMEVCLGTCYCSIARILAKEGDIYGGYEYYLKHIEMSASDLELFKYAGYMPDYLAGCKYVAETNDKDGDAGTAYEYYEKYVRAVEGNPDYKLNDFQKNSYAYALFKMGVFERDREFEYFSRSLALYKELLERNPNSEKLKKNCVVMERRVNAVKNKPQN